MIEYIIALCMNVRLENLFNLHVDELEIPVHCFKHVDALQTFLKYLFPISQLFGSAAMHIYLP